MKELFKKSIPSFIHLVLTIMYIEYVLTWNVIDHLQTSFSTGFIILVLVNIIASTLVSKGQWRQLLISFAKPPKLFVKRRCIETR
jgi:hypothetical protein